MGNLQVGPLEPGSESRWDEFVRAHPLGSPFHLLAWKRAIEATFGYKPYYLQAADQAGVRAVLPLFLVRNLLQGKVLLSVPFAVYGGVLAADEEARDAVRTALEGLARSLAVDHTELRNGWPEQKLGYAPVDRYVTFTQQMADTPELILEAIPRKTRRMVRKSIDNGFVARQTREIGPFEDLYLANLRKLGTPAFPHRHFVNLLRQFGEEASIREVVLDGRVVAAVFTFFFRDQILPYYGAADSALNELAPSNFMYYEQMCWAREQGYRTFDFGRSKKESGSHHFKVHWGMLERELPYEILLGRRKQMPDFSPKNPRFEWAIELWRKVPLPLHRALGPWLIRLVP